MADGPRRCWWIYLGRGTTTAAIIAGASDATARLRASPIWPVHRGLAVRSRGSTGVRASARLRSFKVYSLGRRERGLTHQQRGHPSAAITHLPADKRTTHKPSCCPRHARVQRTRTVARCGVRAASDGPHQAPSRPVGRRCHLQRVDSTHAHNASVALPAAPPAPPSSCLQRPPNRRRRSARTRRTRTRSFLALGSGASRGRAMRRCSTTSCQSRIARCPSSSTGLDRCVGRALLLWHCADVLALGVAVLLCCVCVPRSVGARAGGALTDTLRASTPSAAQLCW